ncbi:MAG: deoxyhypusine synthase family protein [Halobacteriovoraceae bacterium]|nr:deoxyhypusine synthase family protein [Halobacteriovoraceae bacterium]
MKEITQFIEKYYHHFNAAALKDAAEAYKTHVESGKKMMITLAGAMSTAELGKILADMIRADKVQAITCTGANLEEDIFNLVAHDSYVRIPRWRNLSDAEEQSLLERHLNRVTDTCIPEEEAIRKIEHHVLKLWEEASEKNERYFPHEYLYKLLKSQVLVPDYQIDPKNSWMLAACKKNIPIYVPGWEDSTLGNIFAARSLEGKVKTIAMKSGIEYMTHLIGWYRENAGSEGIGFFQIGGGIAGDFPICVVPLIEQDLEENIPLWSYFCQISDSTTSYGSYSGAVPNEKITWGKLGPETPRFIIESDATIVAPLIFAYVLGM